MSALAADAVDGLARDESIREQARAILAREDYARWREPLSAPRQWILDASEALVRLSDWVPDWVVDAWDGLAEILRSLVDAMRAGSVQTGVPLPTQLLAIAAIGALVILAIFVLGHVRRARASRPPSAGPHGRSLEPSWLVTAEALAGEGRYLAAAHHLQLGVIRLLVAGHWLELERSDPNRTLRRRVRGTRLPEAERRDLLELVDRLEFRWFRDRSEDRSLYEDWRRLHTRLAQLGGVA